MPYVTAHDGTRLFYRKSGEEMVGTARSVRLARWLATLVAAKRRSREARRNLQLVQLAGLQHSRPERRRGAARRVERLNL